jgi:hypothetical protein
MVAGPRLANALGSGGPSPIDFINAGRVIPFQRRRIFAGEIVRAPSNPSGMLKGGRREHTAPLPSTELSGTRLPDWVPTSGYWFSHLSTTQRYSVTKPTSKRGSVERTNQIKIQLSGHGGGVIEARWLARPIRPSANLAGTGLPALVPPSRYPVAGLSTTEPVLDYQS